MLAILGYFAAVAALFVGAALGLMVLLGESAELGKNIGSYSENKAAPSTRMVRHSAADLDGGARTTGQAVQTEPPRKRAVRPKAPKNRTAQVPKPKKRALHAARDRH